MNKKIIKFLWSYLKEYKVSGTHEELMKSSKDYKKLYLNDNLE